jgi:hypothetical protein
VEEFFITFVRVRGVVEEHNENEIRKTRIEVGVEDLKSRTVKCKGS